jgi:hypothetical protein
MCRLLLNQPIAFAAGTPGVLLLHARHPRDPDHPRLTPQIGHQGAQQQLAVDPVRLRAPTPLLDRNARGIENEVRDSGRLEQPVQPKAVILAGFVATNHPRHRSELLGRPGADLLDQRQQTDVNLCREIRSRSGLCSVTSHVF